MQEGILTLKSFMIPYLKLCNLPSDITRGLAMISCSISWSISGLISQTYDIEVTDIIDWYHRYKIMISYDYDTKGL